MKGTVEQCNGCDYVATIASICTKLADVNAPAGFWRRGGCPYATHVVKRTVIKEHVRVGQQKQKKGRR